MNISNEPLPGHIAIVYFWLQGGIDYEKTYSEMWGYLLEKYSKDFLVHLVKLCVKYNLVYDLDKNGVIQKET